jgi:hypothetical protein
MRRLVSQAPVAVDRPWDAIEKLNFALLPRKSSDPSEPVRLAPFESTGAGTMIAPTVRLSTEQLPLGDDL